MYSKIEYGPARKPESQENLRKVQMDREQRKKIIAHKLVDIDETVNSWAKKSGLHQRIVADLIDGKLKGTRGVSLETRQKMEEVFGRIFEA
jgi:hypothetical protein